MERAATNHTSNVGNNVEKTMRLQITFLILILFSVKSLACSCVMKPDFKTKEDLNEYKFIAHIKINGVNQAENVETDSYVHQMTFEILELYKGENIKDILVSGSHSSLKGWTSCDLGERVGDEWIIFGYYNEHLKKLTTGYCTRSKKIKLINGYEDLKYHNQLTLKKKLQLLFDKKQEEPFYNGKRIEYYNNGNKQLEENYVNGVINGQRILWYPNKELQSNQYYSYGKKKGTFNWYSNKGNLIKIEKFRNDIPVDTTTIWRDISSKRKVWIKRIFNKKGEILSKVVYRLNEEKESEVIYFPEDYKKIERCFHKNGSLREEVFTEKGIYTGIYKEWNENGKLIRSWEYDEKGKAKKETVKNY